MELRQFTYVNMVAECGSITKAAQKLFISQPALSNYIAKIEDEIGTKLFDRSTNPLVPTYAGEQYIKRARMILMQIDDMDREMRDITQNMTGRIRVGFPGERIISMLPMVLGKFKEIYPNVNVEVVTGAGNHLINCLQSGEVDMIFLPSWIKRKGLTQQKIAEEELVLVAAKGYIPDDYFINRGQNIINWHKISKLPIITLNKGHALRESVDLLYKTVNKKPNIFMESHSNMLSAKLASQGFGFAVIPSLTLNLMKEDENLEVCHIAEIPLKWEVQAIYREDFYIGEVEDTFLRLTKEAISNT